MIQSHVCRQRQPDKVHKFYTCVLAALVTATFSPPVNALVIIEQHVLPPCLASKGRKRILSREVCAVSSLLHEKAHTMSRRQNTCLILSSTGDVQDSGDNCGRPNDKISPSDSSSDNVIDQNGGNTKAEFSTSGDDSTAEANAKLSPDQEELHIWEDADPYLDLDRLEYAINLANAEQNLQHVERLETLDYMAKQRRLLFPDVGKFVVAPLVGALLIARSRSFPLTRPIALLLTKCIDFHFWSLVVMSPMLLLFAKRLSPRSGGPVQEVSDEVKLMSSSIRCLIDDVEWEDPKTSCKDYEMFLLEYWTSAVVGLTVVSCIGRIFLIQPKHRVLRLGMSLAQALTRVAALGSLYQYSGQLFQLEREHQPRPQTIFTTTLQPSVRNMRKMVPLGIASDLSKVLVNFEKESLMALYATISTLLVGLSFRLTAHTHDSQNSLESRSIGNKLIYALAVAAFWRKPISNLAQDFHNVAFGNLMYRTLRAPLMVGLKSAGAMSFSLLSFVGPMYHIGAIKKAIRVVYTHDISLGMDNDAFGEMERDDADFQVKRTGWRYRVNWRRQPKRVRQHVREWMDSWGYWWFGKGTVDEQIYLEMTKKSRTAHMEGIAILDRLKYDIESDPDRFGEIQFHNETKTRIMNRIAYKHQRDHERQKYDDHLGVAVQQIFGIGLGYNFDHMTKLGDGEKPSTRRLQARAAKSAILHMKKLRYNMTVELDALSGPEKKRRSKELDQLWEKERRFFADRLAELVPTDRTNDFRNASNLEQFFKPRSFTKTSSHEMTIDAPLYDSRPGRTVIDIMRDPEYSAEFESLEAFTKDIDITDFDEDEFVAAYMESTEREKLRQHGNDDGSNEKDDDDGPNLVLV